MLGVIRFQAGFELVPRRGAFGRGVYMFTLATDPKLVLGFAITTAITRGRFGWYAVGPQKLDLGFGWCRGAKLRIRGEGGGDGVEKLEGFAKGRSDEVLNLRARWTSREGRMCRE